MINLVLIIYLRKATKNLNVLKSESVLELANIAIHGGVDGSLYHGLEVHSRCLLGLALVILELDHIPYLINGI